MERWEKWEIREGYHGMTDLHSARYHQTRILKHTGEQGVLSSVGFSVIEFPSD